MSPILKKILEMLPVLVLARLAARQQLAGIPLAKRAQFTTGLAIVLSAASYLNEEEAMKLALDYIGDWFDKNGVDAETMPQEFQQAG